MSMVKNKPLFVFSGGLRKGKNYWLSSNYTWPLVRLEIFEKEIDTYTEQKDILSRILKDRKLSNIRR